MRPAQRRCSPLLLSLAAVLLAVSACSSSGGDDDSKSGSAAFEETEGRAPDAPSGNRDSLDRSLNDGDDFAALAESVNGVGPDVIGRKIIAKGNVSLESDDVAAAEVAVQRIVDGAFGEITERQTSTNDDGDISDARLLL